MPSTDTTSIEGFRRDGTVAGLLARFDDEGEAALPSVPVLLTAMPEDLADVALAAIVPVRKRRPLEVGHRTLPRISAVVLRDLSSSPKVWIGRSAEADVVLGPKTVSRLHAWLEPVDARGWLVGDAGSSNGTRVAGQSLAPRQPIRIQRSPVAIEIGPEVTLYLLFPPDLARWLSELRSRASDSSIARIRREVSSASTPIVPIQVPPSRSEAETNPMLNEAADPEGPGALAVTTATALRRGPSLDLALDRTGAAPGERRRQRERPRGESDPRLLNAIRTLVALDSLVLSVSAILRSEHARTPVDLWSASGSARFDDVPDHLLRLEPMLERVLVTLSTGDGRAVELWRSG